MRQPLHFVLLTLCLMQIAHAADNPLDKAPSRFTKINDLKVHYKLLPAAQNRNKPTMLFVHGWCCDMTVWRAQAEAFNGQINMLFIDLPGYGKSDHPRIDYTMDLFAKAMNAVLED